MNGNVDHVVPGKSWSAGLTHQVDLEAGAPSSAVNGPADDAKCDKGPYKRHRDVAAGKGTLLLGKVFLYCLSPRGGRENRVRREGSAS